MGEVLGRILAIEDDESIRVSLRELLRQEGYVVEVASNGQEGLDRMATFLPSVVLLDGLMPVMDGPTFLQHLRRLPDQAVARIPVIVLTGSSKDRFPVCGADDVLRKPVELARLLAILEKYCSATSARS